MAYLMAGQLSELERLQLQSRVWEPAGRRLLDELGTGAGKRVVDIGCGCLGWLRLLSAWVGPTGTCVGTDIDDALLGAARGLVDQDGLTNVSLARDDLFSSSLPPASFDLVHARFQLAPIGRVDEQLAALTALLKPDGILVLEDPDTASWRFEPPATSTMQLIDHILSAFRAGGGNFDAGRTLHDLLVRHGFASTLRAEVVALEPQHPYLRLPLQFATSLRPRLAQLLPPAELDALLDQVATELADPTRWGLTFTLVQAYGRRADEAG